MWYAITSTESMQGRGKTITDSIICFEVGKMISDQWWHKMFTQMWAEYKKEVRVFSFLYHWYNNYTLNTLGRMIQGKEDGATWYFMDHRDSKLKYYAFIIHVIIRRRNQTHHIRNTVDSSRINGVSDMLLFIPLIQQLEFEHSRKDYTV